MVDHSNTRSAIKSVLSSSSPLRTNQIYDKLVESKVPTSIATVDSEVAEMTCTGALTWADVGGGGWVLRR